MFLTSLLLQKKYRYTHTHTHTHARTALGSVAHHPALPLIGCQELLPPPLALAIAAELERGRHWNEPAQVRTGLATPWTPHGRRKP